MDLAFLEYAAKAFEPVKPSPYIGDPTTWARERLKVFLWSKQREIAASVVEHPRTAVKSCHAGGKCTVESAVIQLADGRVAEARDLIGRHFAILAWDEKTGQHVPSLAWASDNGAQPTYRITTSSGREIERTGNHPLWAGRLHGGGSGRRLVVESRGWADLADIVAGDIVLVPERIDVEGRRPRPEDEVKFAGYLLGDGGTTVTVSFTQTEGRPLEEFKKIAETLGGAVRSKSKYGWQVVGPDGAQFGRWGSNPILNMVRSWGLIGKKAIEKRLPDWAWELPNDQLALLLNRLFACDGWATSGEKNMAIGIALASEGLIRDIELAMLRLGICGSVRARTSTVTEKRYSSWEWSLHRLADLERFQSVVGIFGKEDAVAAVVDRKRALGGRASHWMHAQVPPGHRWEKVRSVEPLGDQPTVCISVPDYHAYVTTFVEHNSYLAAVIAAWWIDVHPPGEAFIVSTAPSYPQVHAILWEEIRKQHKAGKLPGRVLLSDEWKLDDGVLVGWGRKPADTDQHGFQGIHRRYVLVILDEACGIPEQLWTAVEAITTNADCRILAIGNPDDPNTEFGKVCKPGSGWNVIRINGLETPNFTDEDVPDSLRPMLLSREWVQDKARRWGESSPRYIAKVTGDFPSIGNDTLIPPALIEAAQQRTLAPGATTALAVDVARFGSDRTVLGIARGPVFRVVGDHGKTATTETTGLAVAAARGNAVHEIRVDGVGVGGGVVDQLLEQGWPVLDMQSGAGAIDSEHYLNARAEWWWGLRERFEQGDIDIDPADDELAAQLGSIKYKFTSRGQIQIESKDDMKKRGLPSPDRADTAMLAYAVTLPPADVFEPDELADADDELSYLV